MDEVDDFLEHHGVKGQKWGFRNSVNKEQRISKGRSFKERLLHPDSATKKTIQTIVGLTLIAKGAYEVNRILKETGHMHIGR